MGIISEVVSIATGLKSLLEKEANVSDLSVKIDRKMEYITIKNIGSANAHNISVEFKNTNWNNPFEKNSFSLSPSETEERGVFLNDYDDDTAVVELSWTDETQGDFYKSVKIGYHG